MPQERDAQLLFLGMEETVARKFCGAILGASNQARVDCSRLAYGNPAEERPERGRGARIRCGAGASIAGSGGGDGVIGLPSLHAMEWMASEATDMRCGLDRQAERVNVSDWREPAKWPSVRVSLRVAAIG